MPVRASTEHLRLRRAEPDDLRLFWPYLRHVLPFRRMRQLRRFLARDGGELLYLQHPAETRVNEDLPPPFILLGRWRSDESITFIHHLHAGPGERRALIDLASREKLSSGSELVVTKPISTFEARDFLSCGFSELEGIVLLERKLNGLPSSNAPTNLTIKRFKKKMLGDVLRLDGETFEPFWRLDPRTMLNIAEQCHRNLFLVAFVGETMAGYAIGGVNGPECYLQRLCVHPAYQGLRIGRELALRTMRWGKARGAEEVLVNTQEVNVKALNLYRSLGFEGLDRRVIMGKGRKDPAALGVSLKGGQTAGDPFP